MSADLYKMASAEFLEQALSTDVDENAVNAIVGSLENQLVTSVSSVSSQNNIVNVIPSQLTNITSNASSIIGVQKYNTDQVNVGEISTGNFQPVCSASGVVTYNNVQASGQVFVSQQSLNNPSEPIKVIYSPQTAQTLSNSVNRVSFPSQSVSNGSIGLSASQNQIIHTGAPCAVIPQGVNKTITMQPPLVIKQGTSTGQVGMQPGLVTVPMTVNSSMPNSIPNVMTLNKQGGQNVVVTTQNLGSGQPAIIPNVQILNMRPGAPSVAAQKSVATVSPRVVIGTPQVVGARAATPGITLQTLQSLQPGQQGHLLLKTENGQYQLLRVGPAPAANTLTAPQAQTIRLSTVPAHPGVQTISTSVAAAAQMQSQMVAGPGVAPAVVASAAPAPPPPQAPTVTTQKPSDNTKEKCRNFLANLLDLSSKEPKSVERNVRNLIQELIDAQVEPEEFCDRLERLLNASPQPCLIGFLKKSLPLLRQSLVTKELVIEGINPPAPHVAFSTIAAPAHQTIMAASNVQLSEEEYNNPCSLASTFPLTRAYSYGLSPLNPVRAIPVGSEFQPLDDDGTSPTLTTLLPPVLMPASLAPALVPSAKTNSVVSVQPPNSLQPLDDDGTSPTLTTLLPPVLMPSSLAPALVPSAKTNSVVSVQPPNSLQPKPAVKPGNTIAVLQNIPVHTKINVSKVGGKAMTVNSKANFNRSAGGAAALSTVLTPGKSLLKEKERKSSSQYSQPFVDDKMAGDDDINDVAAMGGVNLAEETQRILGSTEMIGTQIRSCKDEYLVGTGLMSARLKAAAARRGLEEPTADVAALLTHALHERLKNLIEKLALIAQHRIDLVIRTDSRYEVTQDVKGQLKFLEELDRVDKKRREDSEREMLLRAAKSRSKNEDPEQAKLKAKAKEMQRAEMEELRQREANLTALQAIGPRKKPRLDGPGDMVPNGTTHSTTGLSGRGQMALRSRLKRINHRDIVFLLEQERDTAHTPLIYRSYLK